MLIFTDKLQKQALLQTGHSIVFKRLVNLKLMPPNITDTRWITVTDFQLPMIEFPSRRVVITEVAAHAKATVAKPRNEVVTTVQQFWLHGIIKLCCNATRNKYHLNIHTTASTHHQLQVNIKLPANIKSFTLCSYPVLTAFGFITDFHQWFSPHFIFKFSHFFLLQETKFCTAYTSFIHNCRPQTSNASAKRRKADEKVIT